MEMLENGIVSTVNSHGFLTDRNNEQPCVPWGCRRWAELLRLKLERKTVSMDEHIKSKAGFCLKSAFLHSFEPLPFSPNRSTTQYALFLS